MSDQDFRKRILSSIEDLKRATGRMEDRMERMENRIDSRLIAMEKDVSNLHGDVRWIRGKLEGR